MDVFRQLEPDMTGWPLEQQLAYDQRMYGFSATRFDAETGEEFRVHPLDISAQDAEDAAAFQADA